MRSGNGAILSTDRLYRYLLWRCIAHDNLTRGGNDKRRVVFVMLNPSTADERVNDPTIRKCIGFARRWNFGYVDVVNLFAWRETKPQGLLRITNPEGRTSATSRRRSTTPTASFSPGGVMLAKAPSSVTSSSRLT